MKEFDEQYPKLIAVGLSLFIQKHNLQELNTFHIFIKLDLATIFLIAIVQCD